MSPPQAILMYEHSISVFSYLSVLSASCGFGGAASALLLELMEHINIASTRPSTSCPPPPLTPPPAHFAFPTE
jgi:hypothetical protein